MKALSLCITLLLVTGTSSFAQSGTKDGTFKRINLKELQIRIDAGMDITVVGGPGEEILYLYEFDGNEQAYSYYFENFEPVIEYSGSRGIINITFPDRDGEKKFKIEKHKIMLSLPSEVHLKLMSNYSNIDVKNLDLGLDIVNRSGKVQIENISQTVNVSNEYGSVRAKEIRGELFISNRSATIDAREVTGPVRVNAEYSKLNISQIEGDLNISNRSGVLNSFDIMGNIEASGPYMEYELTNIDGDIRISNKSGKVVADNARSLSVVGDYTPVTASDIRSDEGVDIEGRSAEIRLNNIAGNVVIVGQYLNTNLKMIAGSLRMQNRSAAVTISDLGEDVSIRGEFLDISIKKFKGKNVEIVNRSNDIELEAISKPVQVYLENEYGKIIFHLHKKFDGTLEAKTRYGEFISDFELNNRQLITSQNETQVTGSLGSGSGKMMLINKNGDIRLIRAN